MLGEEAPLMVKIPKIIKEELEKCPFDWTITPGSDHHKIIICGKMVGIFPKGGGTFPNRRAGLNVRSQIRQHIRRLKNGKQ